MTPLSLLLIFKHPRVVLLGLSLLGAINVALQAAFDWHVDFVASEVVFVIFTWISLFAGHLIVYGLPKSLFEISVAIQNTAARPSSRADFLLGNLHTVALISLGFAVGAGSVFTNIQLGLPWSGLVLFVYLGTVFIGFQK